jgi:dCMP deaminase
MNIPPDNKWDVRFLCLAKEIASWSKDPSTRTSAIAVYDRKILATGYNGFPRGIDELSERLDDRDMKYKFMIHAEMNAIYNATIHGISLKGATLYVIGLPICGECAKGIIQVGIRRVVIPIQDVPERWKESCEFTRNLFKEVGIQYDEILA